MLDSQELSNWYQFIAFRPRACAYYPRILTRGLANLNPPSWGLRSAEITFLMTCQYNSTAHYNVPWSQRNYWLTADALQCWTITPFRLLPAQDFPYHVSSTKTNYPSSFPYRLLYFLTLNSLRDQDVLYSVGVCDRQLRSFSSFWIFIFLVLAYILSVYL